MGSDRIFTCKDCKQSVHLGYSGGGGWRLVNSDITDINLLTQMMNNNVNARWSGTDKYLDLLKQHEGHDFFVWSNDSCHFTGNDLYVTGAGWVEDKLLHKDVNFPMDNE